MHAGRMMLVPRVLFPLIAAALVIGCAADKVTAPPNGYQYAAATFSCGPADGPAIRIYFSPTPTTTTQPSTPYLGVSVWQSVAALSGREWSLASGSADGFAWFQLTAANQEVATSGTLTVTSVSTDNQIEGTVDVTFPSAGHVRSAFKATWIPSPPGVLCG